MDIYKRIGLNENQKNLLEFIIRLISKKEGENFTVENVYLCSQFYSFIPNNISIGNMLIIANNAYWQNDKDFFKKRNVTDYQCISQLELTKDKGGKALFLKYKYDLKFKFDQIETRVKFKKNNVIKETLDECDYINAISFPYLDMAIEKLYSNTVDGTITEEIVNKTLQQIELENIVSSSQEINKKAVENNVINSLNGKRM